MPAAFPGLLTATTEVQRQANTAPHLDDAALVGGWQHAVGRQVQRQARARQRVPQQRHLSPKSHVRPLHTASRARRGNLSRLGLAVQHSAEADVFIAHTLDRYVFLSRQTYWCSDA